MLPKKYASTENKERVRKEGTDLIKKEFSHKKRKLSYLGMPSGEMRDILTWKEYFDKSTAVELDPKQRGDLVLNLIKNNLQDKVSILFGDIEDILIKGKDEYGNKLTFPYDVVFLDFFGTILYKGLKRTKAITALIEKQKGSRFLLMLTLNLRERNYCKNSVATIFDKIQTDLSGFYVGNNSTKDVISETIGWYKASTADEMYRQKLFVPYFIKTTAEERGFKVHAYAPIFYLGFNNSPMIHFIFKLIPEAESPTKAVSDQTIIDIINLKIQEAAKGRVFLRKTQAPILNI